MRTPILLFFVFIICLASAMAANPHYSQVSAQPSIQIEIIKQPYYQTGVGEINMSFHVYNSTGFILNTTTTNCTVHIYNASGVHLLEEEADMDDNNIDYIVHMGENITSIPGYYSYTIWCPSINPKEKGDPYTEAGFISDYFEMGHDAPAENAIGGSPIATLIIIPLVFAIIIIAASFIFGETHAVLKIFLFLLGYVMVFVSFWFGVNVVAQYYNFPTIIQNIATAIYIIGTIFFVILAYLLIHAFVVATETAAQDKKARLEY